MNKSFRRKFIFSLFIGILMFMLLAAEKPASAQSELFSGQKHSYTVIFRGNGEAVVFAKININNVAEKPITDFSFELAGAIANDLVIFQQTQTDKMEPVCDQYDYNSPERPRPCLIYRNVVRGSTYKYQKIEYTKTGNNYKFDFPQAIEPQKSSTVIIAYGAFGYVKKTMGLFKYNFQTLKVPARIEKVTVAVDVDTELYIQGKRSEVQYNYESFSLGAAKVSEQMALGSAEMDSAVSKIGSRTSTSSVKEAKYLAANETFIVKGKYAKNLWRLRLWPILITVLIIAAVIIVIYYLLRYIKRRRGTPTVRGATASKQTPGSDNNLIAPTEFFNLSGITVGFISAALVIGFTILINFVKDSDFWRYMDRGPAFMLLTVIVLFLLYVLIIFGPAIFVAAKRGWKTFLWIMLAELIWLIIAFVLYAIYMGFSSGYKPSYLK